MRDRPQPQNRTDTPYKVLVKKKFRVLGSI
ncbi:hypothetical protein MY4824_003759 [Beauveria thailandica]